MAHNSQDRLENSNAKGRESKVVIDNVVRSIHVDGSPDKERYIVKFNGMPVPLTEKSFIYFTTLAFYLKNSNNGGWVYKEDIEPGFNQARYLYRMRNEIKDSLGNLTPSIENNRLGCYRLNVDPQIISFNEELLREHGNQDIKKLFASQ